jgi:flavorubredoxin
MVIIQHVYNLYKIIQLKKMNSMVCFNKKKKIFFSNYSFLDLYQLNRNTYNRVHSWFEQLDAYRRTLISRQLEGYPPCDDLIHGSSKYIH